MGFKEKLLKGERVFTAEISPPRGTDFSRFDSKAKFLKGVVDAVNVTDNQGANLHLSSFGGSLRLLLHHGIEPIMQMTCRDRNRLAIQSDLLAAYAFGIDNILALGGDFVDKGDHPDAKPVYDLDSVNLIRLIVGLNEGVSFSGRKLNGGTDFLIGGVHNIGGDPQELHVMKLYKKIEAGAKFFQTQAIFDPSVVERFFKENSFPEDVHFILGILVPTSVKMINYVNSNVPGIEIPKKILELMERASDPLKTGIDISVGIIKDLEGFGSGFHIMAIYHEDIIPKILDRVR